MPRRHHFYTPPKRSETYIRPVFKDLEVGAKIVVFGRHNPYQKAEVIRITKTQFTVVLYDDNEVQSERTARFSKTTGEEITSNYGELRVVENYALSGPNHLLTWEELDEIKRQEKAEKERKNLQTTLYECLNPRNYSLNLDELTRISEIIEEARGRVEREHEELEAKKTELVLKLWNQQR